MITAETLRRLPKDKLLAALSELTPSQIEELQYTWEFWARPDQLEPEGNWKIWMPLAGRGWGKTRTGAEWVRKQVKKGLGRIACVAPTRGDVRRVMVEGESGLLNVCWKHDRTYRNANMGYPTWSPTNNTLTWENGAVAQFFSAEDPERLRGPQFHAAWCFVKGTPVLTPTGNVEVSTIQVGDIVTTSKGSEKVIGTSVRKQPVGRVVFSGGRELVGTWDHPIRTQSGWIPLGELTKKDLVCVVDVLNTAENFGTLTQVDTTSLPENVYTEGFTKTTSETVKVLTYTTLMETNLTTTRQICRSFQEQATYDFTSENEAQFQSHQKVKENFLVTTVELKFSEKQSQDKVCSVSPANIDEQTRKEKLLELANTAAKSLEVGSETCVLSIVSTWQPLGEQNVYNIQVENTAEYFANGILTHNCDEICAWNNMEETWDMLQFTLRLGKKPRVLITTTPKPVKLIRTLLKPENIESGRVYRTSGSSYDNKDNIDLEALSQYEGTRLGRQELYAEILDEAAGALWNRNMIDEAQYDLPEGTVVKAEDGSVDYPASRVAFAQTLARVVVSVDPAVSANEESDMTGIIVAGVDVNGTAYIIEDATDRYLPEQWAAKAAELFDKYQADLIVAERNQGGEMVKHTIRTVNELLPIKMVHASRGKFARAEPVSSLYERKKVKHLKYLESLEEQMVTWEPLGSIGSPDRLDAMVWAITNLLLKGYAQAPVKISYGALSGISF